MADEVERASWVDRVHEYPWVLPVWIDTLARVVRTTGQNRIGVDSTAVVAGIAT